jgi:hypothetical protein
MGQTPRRKNLGVMDYMVTPSMLSTLAPPLLQPVEPIESATFTSTATTAGDERAAERMKEDVETMLLEAADDPAAALKANLKVPIIMPPPAYDINPPAASQRMRLQLFSLSFFLSQGALTRTRTATWCALTRVGTVASAGPLDPARVRGGADHAA